MSDSCAPKPPSSDTRERALATHQRIQALVQLERRAMRELALALAAMQADKLYRQLGYAGMVEYGEQAFGFSPSKTRQLALLGRKLPELPVLDQAMCSGALGWTKARTLLPILSADNEEEWIERASEVPNRELEEQVSRAQLGAAPPDPEEDWPDLNFVWTRMRLEPLHFERLMKAVAHIRHELGDFDMSLSQCLMAMADRVLAHADHDHERTAPPDHERTAPPDHDRMSPSPERCAPPLSPAGRGGGVEAPAHVCREPASPPVRIIAHRCPSCERAWLDSPTGRLELDRRDQQALESDAELVAGDESAGTPGHITRTIPPATRRAVLIRDRGRCQVPGCRCRDHLALHHIRFRSQGGTHDPDNLITLCWAHHDMLHRGVLHLERAADGTLRWDRGPGEALALTAAIQGDRAELEHAALADFEGPSGSWYALATYFGQLEPLEVDAAPDPAHVCHGERPPLPPTRPRYPRGRQELRLGDDRRMAPRCLHRNLRV
jgi:hypothetical protein